MVDYETYVQVNEKLFNEHMKEFAKEIREKTEFKTEKLRYIRLDDENNKREDVLMILADNVPVAKVTVKKNGFTGGEYYFKTQIFMAQNTWRFDYGSLPILKKYMISGVDLHSYKGLVK